MNPPTTNTLNSSLMEAEVARFRELLPDTERFEKWRKNLNLFAAARHARWKRNSSYLRFLTENDQFESYFVRAFAERRWTLHGIHRKSNDHSRKLAIIGPMEFIPHQNRCYHATPKSNLASILDRGILPGHDSGQRTTKRDDSSHYIHVSTSHEDACHWRRRPIYSRVTQQSRFPSSRSISVILARCYVMTR